MIGIIKLFFFGFFLKKFSFTPNFNILLCMHKKHTKYRFKLWYKH